MTTHLTKIWWDLNKHKLVEQAIPEAEIYKRQWVPLTDEQIRKCFFRDDVPPSSPPYWWEYRDPDYRVIYALIDKALKEKNAWLMKNC